MIFRGGRGFMTGWVGVILICFALTGIMICCCCWCANLFSKRRRNDLDSLDSETGPIQSSPQLLKILAQPEVMEGRRQSNYNSALSNEIENPQAPPHLPINQEDSSFNFETDRICPYPPTAGSAESAITNFVPMPMPYDGTLNTN